MPVPLESIVGRMVCHVIVDQMPDDGILEALRTLENMKVYYLEMAAGEPRLSSPIKHSLKAKIGKRNDRPVISIPNPAEDI